MFIPVEEDVMAFAFEFESPNGNEVYRDYKYIDSLRFVQFQTQRTHVVIYYQ